MPLPRTTNTLCVPHDELNLDYTLTSGQTFRWRKLDNDWWTGVVRGKVIRIREAETGFEWQTFPKADDIDLISDYFRVSDDLAGIYSRLAGTDDHLAGVIDRFRGLRLLRQDPEETLLSFICSAANSIPRISASIEELSRRYGSFITSIDGIDYYSFPTIEAIAEADPLDISKATGLGFRGQILKHVAERLREKPDGWLSSLRNTPYEQAKPELVSLHGVGQKIADCVCLFALSKDEAVPVDTHVRQLAVRLYMQECKTKSITCAAYARIGDYFRERFNGYAGWAQQFLYYEDLLRGRVK
jgi:N-glycosylase/DNA lyase